MKQIAICIAICMFAGCNQGNNTPNINEQSSSEKNEKAALKTLSKADTQEVNANEDDSQTVAKNNNEEANEDINEDIDDANAKEKIVLLPDNVPAGAPFASTIAAAMAEVTQGKAVETKRIYRAAYENALRDINADNVKDRLRELEHQIDKERQKLP
ncbi:MAG: hypothetical protein JW841_17160 [Deltaproteobacteria bacterium]|nr:hypothetical protein [Deltaproteobacteria bacterium]